jgi:hypothetical protein
MNASPEEREWIIQRCTQRWNGIELVYQDCIGAELFHWTVRQIPNFELMTYSDMLRALDWCAKKWPDEEFRGHNVANCRCEAHRLIKPVGATNLVVKA